MKILFISDLDGTLLNENAELSPTSAYLLNSLIEEGMYFTAATARTEATAVKILEKLNVNVPAVLMNGVVVYDIKKREYEKINYIGEKGRSALVSAAAEFDLRGFMYVIENGMLSVYYENADEPHAREFIEERRVKYGKKFTRLSSFSECMEMNTVYFSVADKEENLREARERLAECDELRVEFYRDVYNEAFWYLEVCSAEASKYNAVMYLREKYSFDRVVSFGDNLNDLPLFRASDECFAVLNAKPEIKAAAHGITGANTEDGVARFLTEVFKSVR